MANLECRKGWGIIVKADNGKVRPAVRQARILEVLAKTGEAGVDALAEAFTTSAATIRRDLTALADAGFIRKIHGGARMVSVQGEGHFAFRMRQNLSAKRLIAEKLVKVVKPGQTLFLDTGSTTLICAEAIAHIKRLTIITNSTRVAHGFAAGSGGADIYLLGGAYRGDNGQTVGGGAVLDVGTYSADLALLTVGALDPTGAMDFSKEEAEVARAMIRASAGALMLADHSKFNKLAAFKLGALRDFIGLVSDRPPTGQLEAALKNASVELFSKL